MPDSDIAPRWRPVCQFLEELIPFNRHLGVVVAAVDEGRCVLRLPWQDHLVGDPFRPSVHGGVTSALVDTAGGMACFTLLSRVEDRVSTVDIRVDYLRPGAGADLFCEATVVRMGNRVAAVRMEVYCGGWPGATEGEPPQPIATGHAVYNVLRSQD